MNEEKQTGVETESQARQSQQKVDRNTRFHGRSMTIDEEWIWRHSFLPSIPMNINPTMIVPPSLIAGYVAGICGTMIGHPFDSIKVLLQTRWSYPTSSVTTVAAVSTGSVTPMIHTNTVKSLNIHNTINTNNNTPPSLLPVLRRSITLSSSTPAAASLLSSSPSFTIRSLYAGISGPLLTVGLIQCINFSIYDTCRQYLYYNFTPYTMSTSTPNLHHKKTSYLYHDSIQNVGISSFISGGIVSIITSPLAIIKTKQQIMSWNFKQAWKDTMKGMEWKKQSKTTKRYTTIYSSFFIGFTPHFICESIGRSIYLMTYESLKRLCISWNHPTGILQQEQQQDYSTTTTYISLTQRMICAALSGIASWSFIFPLDVLRSRIYYESISNSTSHSYHTKSTWKMIQQMYHDNGKSISIFFRGYVVTILRAGPVAAVVLPVYDQTLDWLT